MSEALIPALSLLSKSTLIVCFAWALVLILKALRADAATRHFVWLTAFAAIASLPVLALALPQITIALPYSALGFATPDLSIPGEHLPDQTTAGWIWVAYALGAGAMLARLLGARAALSALWRRARTHELHMDIEAIKRLACVSVAVEVRVSDQSIAPLTWGSRVLLPADAAHWPSSRVHDVLLHELCHMARRDSLTQVLAAFVRAAFWFSPAVWFALRELRIEQEHACDERVLASGVASADYAQTLLDVAMGSPPSRLGMGVSTAMVQRSNLEQRVMAILKPVQPRRLRRAHTAALGAVLLCAGAALAAAQPRDSARILGSLAPLTAIQQPLGAEAPRLAPLSRLTARVDVPDAQDADSKR